MDVRNLLAHESYTAQRFSYDTFNPTHADPALDHPAIPTPPSTRKHSHPRDDDLSDHSSTPGTAEKKARKRNRAALSCSECKRRKIRCDRKTPCEACCKRGEEKLCHWESPRVDAAPQPFALATEYEKLKQRVALLEAYILGGNSPAIQNAEADPSGSNSVRGENGSRAVSTSNHTPTFHRSSVEEEELPDSDTEDAALVLEELALGRKLDRLGYRSRKPYVAAPPNPPPLAPPISSRSLHPVSRTTSSLIVAPLESRRRLVMDDIFRTLPSDRPLLDWLVTHYFKNCDWGWHLHHKPTFLAEYKAFTELMSQGRKDEVDPLWLASFFATLCLSVNSLESSVESPLVKISVKDLEVLPERFFDAAQSCLESGDWTGKPRIRTLQTIVLFAPYLIFAGTPSSRERHQTYLSAGLSIAQQLGLHLLGSQPDRFPQEDPALPTGMTTLRREIPIRLLYVLLFLEFMSVRNTPKSTISPGMVQCALPGNYNDSDLVPTEGLVEPRPDTMATDISFEIMRYKVALLQRRFNGILTGDEGFAYESIIELDKGYRDILAAVPAELRMDYLPLNGEDLSASWRRAMITQTINNRLLRLHRPFMSRGYRQPKYHYSTQAAIEAARTCLIAQQALNRAPLIKSGFQLLNVQGAVIVLFFELWTEWPEHMTESDDHKLIRDALPFFERCLTSRHLPVRSIAQQNLQVTSLIFEAIEKRRAVCAERIEKGGAWVDVPEVESFGRLLKRIGSVVVSAAAASSSSESSIIPTQHSLKTNGLHLPDVPSSSSLAASSSSSSGPAPVIDPRLVPGINWSDAALFPDSSAGDFDSGIARPDSFLNDSTTVPFDIASLVGPEYDPSFDWNSTLSYTLYSAN